MCVTDIENVMVCVSVREDMCVCVTGAMPQEMKKDCKKQSYDMSTSDV